MAAPPRVVVGTPAFEAAAVREEIDNLELLHTGADLPATVARRARLLDKARRENPRLRHGKRSTSSPICSGPLGRPSWARRPRTSSAGRAPGLAQAGHLVVIDLGQPAAENLAVTGLRAVGTGGRGGPTVSFEASVEKFRQPAANRQAVELLVDGRRAAAAERSTFRPAARRSARFSYRFETPGDHAVEVRAEGDCLGRSTTIATWSCPCGSRSACCASTGRPSGEPFRGATDYLAAALAPDSGRGEAERSASTWPRKARFLERDLGGYDCVFLCDVAQFTAGEARVLDAYLGRGGNLVFFLGDAGAGRPIQPRVGRRGRAAAHPAGAAGQDRR